MTLAGQMTAISSDGYLDGSVDGPPVVCIVGATASGKSALADALAKTIGGEVVSADSMQVYRGMDIGTAKMPVEERSVPYHCIDIVDPDADFSAVAYRRCARAAIGDIRGRGKVPVVCGGTGFYIRAALDRMEFPAGVAAGSEARRRYEELAATMDPDAFWALLDARDPESASLIHPHNTRRIVKAFELLEAGSSYHEQNRSFSQRESLLPTCYIGLEVDPSVLYERIERRVDGMISAGLLDEVSRLMSAGFTEALCAPQAIGYKEFVPWLLGRAGGDGSAAEGGSSPAMLDEAIAQVKKATRHYARRQRTWFRADGRISWLHADQGFTQSLLDEALRLIDCQ